IQWGHATYAESGGQDVSCVRPPQGAGCWGPSPREEGPRSDMKRRELFVSFSSPSNGHFLHQKCLGPVIPDTLDSSFVRVFTRSPRRRGPAASRQSLLLRLVEISQIRRRLILLRGHQVAIGAQEIILLADDHMMVVLGTNRLAPDRVFFCI